ncbi:MAG: BatA and WFA domain-containing protein [Bacteroidales bacterium]|jgi:hypothetical protein|nr:BatA and WFA domain-containing protein [Bacteroidales bacterium]HOI32416.1 BatA and WFA domain-containing protein [Bacteroidales bacterium]
MEFLNPSMLYGLLVLAIPVIVHLFNFRKHKMVYFSDISLLENLKQQTSRTSRLRQLIILLIRLFALAAIVLAFARPVFTDPGTEDIVNQKVSFIYVDNSQSMQLAGTRGALIDDARNAAVSLVKSMEPDRRFILLTNDFNPAHEYQMSRDEMLEKLQRISIGGSTISMMDLLERANGLVQKIDQKYCDLYMFSDFQRSAFTELSHKAHEKLKLVLIPFEATQQNNVFIDSVWLTNPVVQTGIPVELNVKISNQSEDQLRSLALRLSSDNSLLAIANADLDNQEDKVFKMSFVPQNFGYINAQLSIEDYPVIFDDTYYLSLFITPKLDVLEIFTQLPDPSLELLFGEDSLFKFVSHSILQVDVQKFNNYHLIIAPLDERMSEGLMAGLTEYVKTGGSLLLLPVFDAQIPSQGIVNELKMNFQPISDTAATRLNSILVDHPFFDEMFTKIPENADLPSVRNHFRSIPGIGSFTLISLLNGDPFLTFNKLGQGSVFHLATPLDVTASGFTESSLFPPILIRMAFYGLMQNKLSFTRGSDRYFTVRGNIPAEDVLRIRSVEGDFEIIPGISRRQQQLLLQLEEPLPEAGFYGIYHQDSLLGVTAWNESRKESRMDFYEVDEAREWFESTGFEVSQTIDISGSKSIEQAIASKDKGLWWWFVLWAVIFLFTEALLIRFWKSNTNFRK